ncbi:MAG: SCP2 sterol-binding domain-containing protein [Gammaproteobacteria bacterium]
MQNPAANALLAALERATDALLDLDPEAKQQLAQLRGKVFCIEVTAPPVTLYLLPSEEGIALRREHEAADVTVRGSAAAFAELARASRAGNAADAFGAGKIQFRGDAELAQTFQKILAEFDLDFEELLSRRIGDTPARKAALAARGLTEWAEKSFELSRENVADYLTEEKHAALPARLAARFGDALDHTRADVDRLSRRVQRIRRELERRAGR